MQAYFHPKKNLTATVDQLPDSGTWTLRFKDDRDELTIFVKTLDELGMQAELILEQVIRERQRLIDAEISAEAEHAAERAEKRIVFEGIQPE